MAGKEPILVMPGSYGILEPKQDSRKVDRLATVSISINFPMAFRSVDRSIGMFTVIDVASRSTEVIKTAIELFRGRGINEVTLQTANFRGQVARDRSSGGDNQLGAEGINSVVLRGMSSFFSEAANSLGQRGIQVVKTVHLEDSEFQDPQTLKTKKANAALFTVTEGITLVPNDQIPYDNVWLEMIEEARHKSIMNAILHQGIVLPLRCAYRPNLVLPSA